MRAFGRSVGIFILMLATGYAAMVLLLPPAPSSMAADGLQTGRSAAVQLSEQAGALIGRRANETAARR